MNNAAIKIEDELSPMTKKEFEQKLRELVKKGITIIVSFITCFIVEC